MKIGFVQFFDFGDVKSLARALKVVKELRCSHLRTNVSWADWVRCDNVDEGVKWYDYVFQKTSSINILPVINCTPPLLGKTDKTSSPPIDTKYFRNFIDNFINRHGRHFTHIELWYKPNQQIWYDQTSDPDFKIFAEMMKVGSEAAHKHGIGTIFPGPSPTDHNWLRKMDNLGILSRKYFDVLGMNAFPLTFEDLSEGWPAFQGWDKEILMMKSYNLPIWITETGYSHFDRSGEEQAVAFTEVVSDAKMGDVERLYWFEVLDANPFNPTPSIEALGYNDGWNPHEFCMGVSGDFYDYLIDINH